MNEQKQWSVPESSAGTRIDQYLAETEDMTRSAAAKLLENGAVTVNGKPAAKNYRLRAGDEIVCDCPEPEVSGMEAQDLRLDVVFEDADILVVNKPQGMVVHPAAGNPDGTLVNGLLYHCGDSLSGIGGVVRPGIVHRIDKDTSGLLVVAKNDAAHQGLAEQLKTHAVSRVYHAIALGNLKEDRMVVDRPIGRHPTDRKKMAIVRDGREAVTHVEVLRRYGAFTYLRCELETGRTHQIRVHLASCGHPLLGDPVYGGDGTRFQAQHKELFCGQCLHAKELRLIHPRSGEAMRFTCPLPENFTRVLELLEKTADQSL